jgi:hypothetical protein
MEFDQPEHHAVHRLLRNSSEFGRSLLESAVVDVGRLGAGDSSRHDRAGQFRRQCHLRGQVLRRGQCVRHAEGVGKLRAGCARGLDQGQVH